MLSERCADQENSDAGADPPRFRGKAEVGGTVRANKFHQTCRGIGDGMYAKRSEEHTSELKSHLNIVCRLPLERKNWLTGMAERLVGMTKPGNSCGGKETPV